MQHHIVSWPYGRLQASQEQFRVMREWVQVFVRVKRQQELCAAWLPMCHGVCQSTWLNSMCAEKNNLIQQPHCPSSITQRSGQVLSGHKGECLLCEVGAGSGLDAQGDRFVDYLRIPELLALHFTHRVYSTHSSTTTRLDAIGALIRTGRSIHTWAVLGKEPVTSRLRQMANLSHRRHNGEAGPEV